MDPLKNISILPIEYKKKQKAYEMISVYILSAVLALLAFAVIFIYIYAGNRGLATELASVREQNESMRGRIDTLEPYRQAQDKIRSTKELIVKAAGTNPDWAELFNEICFHMPSNVWLNEIAFSYTEQSKEMKLHGSSLTQYGVAQWLDRLKKVQGLENVSIKLSSGDGAGGLKGIQFEIGATVLAGEQWKLDSEKGAEP